MSSRYITFPIPVDARDIMERMFAYIQAKNPNWEPSEGQLDTWIMEGAASEAADIGTLASQVDKAIFRTHGQQLFGVQPIDETAATGHINIYVTDTLGHTIPAGTQVGIRNSLGDLIAFTVLSDATVAVGQNHVDNVLIVAAIPGLQGTGLGSIGGTVELVDPILWVDHILQADVTAGGQDAETDDDYLRRLAVRLQLMSPRPILANDFSVLARDVAGVQRATTIDGYNPADNTTNNERMVTVYSLDSNGAGVDLTHRNAVKAYLDAMRELNFVVNVDTPTSHAIDANIHVKVLPDFSLSDVESRVYDAASKFLDPRYWGLDPSDNPNNPVTWINQSTIWLLEFASVVNNVAGVDRVTILEYGLSGGALAATDLVMTGKAPLPAPGTITVVGAY